MRFFKHFRRQTLLTSPEGVKTYIRVYCFITSLRLSALGIVGFIDTSLMEGVAFNSLAAIAPQYVWAAILCAIGLVMGICSFLRYGITLRLGLIFSSMMMMMTAASFTVAAYAYGVAWWAIIPYVSIGIKDMLVAAYPGEIKHD